MGYHMTIDLLYGKNKLANGTLNPIVGVVDDKIDPIFRFGIVLREHLFIIYFISIITQIIRFLFFFL